MREGRIASILVDQLSSFLENLIDFLEVVLGQFQQNQLSSFKLVLDAWTVQQAFKAFEQLELANQSVTVVEGLGKKSCESPFELLDGLAEYEKVIIEGTLLDVHHIVGDLAKLLLGCLELTENLADCLGEDCALGVTNLDVVELVELHDSLSHEHEVLAAFSECVEPHEQRA